MDTMRDIVLHGRGRPEIPSSWLVHQVSQEQLAQRQIILSHSMTQPEDHNSYNQISVTG